MVCVHSKIYDFKSIAEKQSGSTIEFPGISPRDGTPYLI
jgi:hypothetical protein